MCTTGCLSDGVLSVILLRVKHFPSRSGEYVFVPLIIASLDDLSSVRFVLFFGGISEKTNVVMNVEVEKGS